MLCTIKENIWSLDLGIFLIDKNNRIAYYAYNFTISVCKDYKNEQHYDMEY